MITETISISDKFQVEFKLGYDLHRDQKHTAYTIEIYIFLPSSLGLNHETYPRYLFYRDIQTYIRFMTPVVLMSKMREGQDSPMRLLENSLHDLAREPTKSAIKHYENQNKMFCSIFRASLRRHVNLIHNCQSQGDIGIMVDQYLADVPDDVREFRKLYELLAVENIDEERLSTFAFSDEYLSLTVEQLTFDILEELRRFDNGAFRKHTKKLIALINDEVEYRKKKDYPSIAVSGSNNEKFIYRSSVLKKFTESILFLNTKVRPEGKIIEQMIFSFAAGLAMVFATAVAFYTQAKYGNFTMMFFLALVISYMLKDRIKELVRIYLNDKIQRFFYDHKVNICSGSARNKLGLTREGFSFISEGSLSPEVLKLRGRDRFNLIDNELGGEKIILYRKQVKIFTRNFDDVYQSHPIHGINDITRLNISRFVRKMDNPKKTLFVTEGNDYRRINGNKVYHLNMVVKHTSQDKVEYNRFRVVLNRNGIKRIEEVKIS